METEQKKIKNRGGGKNGNESGSAWEAEEKIELPDIDETMEQIDKTLNKTKGVKVEQERVIQRRRRSGCC